jgi:hypothetical protein
MALAVQMSFSHVYEPHMFFLSCVMLFFNGILLRVCIIVAPLYGVLNKTLECQSSYIDVQIACTPVFKFPGSGMGLICIKFSGHYWQEVRLFVVAVFVHPA